MDQETGEPPNSLFLSKESAGLVDPLRFLSDKLSVMLLGTVSHHFACQAEFCALVAGCRQIVFDLWWLRVWTAFTPAEQLQYTRHLRRGLHMVPG
jgi:hypothetical protein